MLKKNMKKGSQYIALTVHERKASQIDLTTIELFDITVLKCGRRSLSTRVDILQLSLDCTRFSDSLLVNEVLVQL